MANKNLEFKLDTSKAEHSIKQFGEILEKLKLIQDSRFKIQDSRFKMKLILKKYLMKSLY